MPIDKIASLKHQHGKVSLQNIFWVVGIIVGLLTILQFVLPYMVDRSNNKPNLVSPVSKSGLEPELKTESEPEKVVKEAAKPSVLDTPSTMVGKYIAYDNGIAVDNDLGIIWMRCSLGQNWNGSHCDGSAKAYSKDEAQQAIDALNKVSFVGLYDWQIPDIEALHSLLNCSDGYEGSYAIPLNLADSSNATNTNKTVAVDCAGNSKVPAINVEVFPDTQWAVWRGYWSNSQNDEGVPLALYFNDGKIKAKDKAHYVRPMRVLNPN